MKVRDPFISYCEGEFTISFDSEDGSKEVKITFSERDAEFIRDELVDILDSFGDKI